MIPKVLTSKINLETQTELSAFNPNSDFNFENDQNTLLALENPQLSYEQSMVEGIIQPLGIAKDGTVINHHIPRLFKKKTIGMIRNLQEQIEANPGHREEFVRQMAAALIPGLSERDYHSLFTTPLKLPYRVVPGILKLDGQTETVPCTAIFSLDSTLGIVTETQTIRCQIELWDTIISGRELNLISNGEPFGKLQINETVEPVDFNSHVPPSLLHSLQINTEDQLVNIISPDDTSFVDVVLSIPTLNQNEANDLLTILHTKKLLSPYIRSKVCALQLWNPNEQRKWPELLGRFIFLLDPKWTFNNIQHLQNNDVMTIFRHVKDMNGGALYALQTALNALNEVRGSDPIIFFWTLLFLSIMQNAAFSKKQHAAQLQTKMVQMWRELQKKNMDSGTRKLTTEVIDGIRNIKQFKLDGASHDELEFVFFIIKDHHNEMFKILDLIPYKREESHPLFFPTVLALETALNQAARNEELITSQSESMNGDFESTSYTSQRRSRTHSSSSRESSSGTESDTYQSYSSRSRSTHSSRSSRNQPPEIRRSRNQSSTIDSGAEINSDVSGSSRGQRRRRSQQQEDVSSGYSESYSSRRSSTSSRRAPPPPMVEKQQNDDSEEDYYDYDDDEQERNSLRNTVPSSSSGGPQEPVEYSDYEEDDQQQKPPQKQQSAPYSPMTTSSRSRKTSSNYSVTDSYYSESVEEQIPIPPEKPASNQQDDYDYYDEEEDEEQNNKSRTQPSAQRGSSASRSQRASSASRGSSQQNQERVSSQRQSNASNRQSNEFNSQQSQGSSRAKMAAIRAAQQKSSQSGSQHPAQDAYSDDDYEEDGYSDDNTNNVVKNTATTGYKTGGNTGSYTPASGTHPSSKRSSRGNTNNDDNPIEDKEENLDEYEYEYSD